MDKSGFQNAFNELISNSLDVIELLVKKNDLNKSIKNNNAAASINTQIVIKNGDYIINENNQMTFRDMVVSEFLFLYE